MNQDGKGVATGYRVMPESFADQPNGGLGSAYNGGWESYVVKALQQVRGGQPGAPLSSEMTSRLCVSGLGACPAAVGSALVATYDQLASVNGTSTVASWTADTETNNLPANDSIRYKGVGLIGQPNMDWQNRPTFQQVADFPTHRPRAGDVAATSPAPETRSLPLTSSGGSLWWLIPAALALGAAVGLFSLRRKLE